VPKDEVFVEEYLNEVLEKYSEEYQVDPHIEVEKSEILGEYKRQNPNESIYPEEEKYDKILEWTKDYYGYSLSDEEGNLLSTSNTDSFYDWYVVGGRWDGYLTDNKDNIQDGDGYGDEHYTISNNSIEVSELLEKYKKKEKELYDPTLEFAENLESGEISPKENKYLLTRLVVDGEYIEGFGVWETPKSKIVKEWKEKYLNILEKHKGDTIINIDCHR